MRRLLVLRPEPGASRTVARAHAVGLDARALPLFQIEAIPADWPPATDFDALLLTSANGARALGQRYPGLPVHAVGGATADIAAAAGHQVVTIGDGGVDDLLARVPFDVRLLHPCGIERRVPSSAHRVTPLPVYRATPLDPPDLAAFGGDEVVLLHSPRAATRWAAVVERAGFARDGFALVAISDATAAAAGTGWQTVEIAPVPRDEALLPLAARLCHETA